MSAEVAEKTTVTEVSADSGAGKRAANASCSSPAAGSGCPLCRCLGWFAGMWRVLLAYLLGVGLLALLMTIMRRMQQ